MKNFIMITLSLFLWPNFVFGRVTFSPSDWHQCIEQISPFLNSPNLTPPVRLQSLPVLNEGVLMVQEKGVNEVTMYSNEGFAKSSYVGTATRCQATGAKTSAQYLSDLIVSTIPYQRGKLAGKPGATDLNAALDQCANVKGLEVALKLVRPDSVSVEAKPIEIRSGPGAMASPSYRNPGLDDQWTLCIEGLEPFFGMPKEKPFQIKASPGGVMMVKYYDDAKLQVYNPKGHSIVQGKSCEINSPAARESSKSSYDFITEKMRTAVKRNWERYKPGGEAPNEANFALLNAALDDCQKVSQLDHIVSEVKGHIADPGNRKPVTRPSGPSGT